VFELRLCPCSQLNNRGVSRASGRNRSEGRICGTLPASDQPGSDVYKEHTRTEPCRGDDTGSPLAFAYALPGVWRAITNPRPAKAVRIREGDLQSLLRKRRRRALR